MKYTIEGLSQRRLVELGLDCVDAVIIRFILDFYHTGKMTMMSKDGEEYFWLKYDAVIEQLPLSGIKTKDALYRRMKKYVQCGLMKHATVAINGTFSVYRFQTSMLLGIVGENRGGSDEKSDPPDEKSELTINLLSINKTSMSTDPEQTPDSKDIHVIQDLSLSRTPQIPPPPPSGQPATSHNSDDRECPVDRLERLWDYLAGKHSLAMPTKPLTATRRHMLAVRAKQGMAEKCRDICKAFSESPLLQGNVVRKDTQHERPWKPDFEWLFKNDTNWVKVIEGKYADRVQQEQAPNNEAW